MKTDYRLAIRREGPVWNAYLAKSNTMDGAIQIASVDIDVVQDTDLRAAFVAFVQMAMAEKLRLQTGLDVQAFGEPTDAPERERAGRA